MYLRSIVALTMTLLFIVLNTTGADLFIQPHSHALHHDGAHSHTVSRDHKSTHPPHSGGPNHEGDCDNTCFCAFCPTHGGVVDTNVTVQLSQPTVCRTQRPPHRRHFFSSRVLQRIYRPPRA